MNQRDLDGILITRPTRQDVESLHVGDLAPTALGHMRRVTEIIYTGTDIHGRAYKGYYTEFGDGAQLSGSITEGEPVATVPATSRYHRTENYPAWEPAQQAR